MSSLLARNSTIVRSYAKWAALRTSFRIGGLLAPDRTAARAGALFATPLPGSRQRALKVSPDGASTTRFDAGLDTVAEYVWGDPNTQPYVLFAHGWSSHGCRILPWVQPLAAAGMAVVAFDQLGHGRSGGTQSNLPSFIDTLTRVAERHGPAAAVIGHSLGGAAAGVALARGLRAQHAVLVAPAADPLDASYRFARQVGLSERLCQSMVRNFETMLGIRMDDLQAHRNAPAIGCPALVVHDVADVEVPWAEGERWARYWPRARMISTAGLGHRRIMDDPAVIEAAVAFLGGEPVGERLVASENLPYGVA